MTIRYIYILEDENGQRRAFPLLRGIKLHATINKTTGKIWRVTIAMKPGRDLYSALYNQEDVSLTDWTLVSLLEKGRLRKPPATAA